MFMLNFVHCEVTACDSDNKQSLILSYYSSINSLTELVLAKGLGHRAFHRTYLVVFFNAIKMAMKQYAILKF